MPAAIPAGLIKTCIHTYAFLAVGVVAYNVDKAGARKKPLCFPKNALALRTVGRRAEGKWRRPAEPPLRHIPAGAR